MKVLGIIAEYNPFHNGHKYHLEQSLKQTGAYVTVAVMSGNFVQRGEPALLNKWIRSEMAVRNGIDLVLELPFAYACNNADIFARGAVSMLDSLNCVDYLSFGSESGDVSKLKEVASFLEPESEEFKTLFKEKMKKGKSYPAARAESMEDILGKEASLLVESPNNVLGIEYLKWLLASQSKIKPNTVLRHGAGVDGINEEQLIAGATAIRNLMDEGKLNEALNYVTDVSKEFFSRGVSITGLEEFKSFITYSIISRSHDELKDIYSITEGLENKVGDAAIKGSTVSELVSLIKSKRYTETRIKRILIHGLIGLTKEKMNKILNENQMYGRVLGFSEKGAELIKYIKKEESSSIKIITNISKESDELKWCKDLFDLDIRASDIYNLATNNDIYKGSDYRQIPAYVKPG